MLKASSKAFHVAGLGQAALSLNLAVHAFSDNKPHDLSALKTELATASREMLRDIANHHFLSIAADRDTFVDQEALFGDAVSKAFPSAAEDLREAGNCLATECNTAAVFHLMRVVEWGLRALAVDLGVKKIPKSRRCPATSSGVVPITPVRIKYVPIAFSEWERILSELQTKLDAKMLNARRGARKQKMQEFYYPMIQDIIAIKEAYRNHVMHARRFYTREDAVAVLSHVSRIMKTLATQISGI